MGEVARRAGAVAMVVGLLVVMVSGALTVDVLAAPGDDPFLPRQWALQQIGAPAAWTAARGNGVTIGVVDTGVDLAHPDLAGKIVGSADCVGKPCAEGGGQDANGHGTLVSGIAAASTGNGRGVAGVAPDASLLVARVLASNGEGRIEDINAGIRWVVDRGAKVVNLSLGDPQFLVTSLLGTPLRTGIEYAWSRGAVPVLASGNYNTGIAELGSQNYGSLNAIVVGATDRAGAVASYSSAIGNAKWGAVAPGGAGAGGADNNVISTYLGGEYASTAGTSMAAPHVSGALAVLLSQGLSPTAAVQRLLGTVDRIPCGRGCQGRLNLAAATGPGPLTPPAPAPEEPDAPPTTRGRPAPTSTSAPPRSTTTSTPPPVTSAPPPTVVIDPSELAAGRSRSAGGDSSRSPVPIAAAAVLLVGVAGALATTVVRIRFTGAGGW